MKENCRIPWPQKYDLFGVQVSATTYDESVALILQAAKQRMATITSFCAAHAIVTASRDRALLQKINTFHVIGPDGHPAWNRLHVWALSGGRSATRRGFARASRAMTRSSFSGFLEGLEPVRASETCSRVILEPTHNVDHLYVSK